MSSETFAPLSAFPFITHHFTLRGSTDAPPPSAATAEQPHGNAAAVVTAPGEVSGADALVTRQKNLPLIIRCADCPTVFIVDKKAPAIALVHSGKKGTALNIVGATVTAMRQNFGDGDYRAFISPSIGPCHYEVDLWLAIETQLRTSGLSDIHNPRICTACHLDRYYSYRAEKGHNGRMFALLMLK